MSRRLTVSPSAARALQNARAWLLQPGSGRTAARKWRALQQVGRRLIKHPYIGKPISDQPPHRLLVVSDYTLIYRVDPDTSETKTAGDIFLVAVFGPGQDTKWP